jgi:hypothetical protein
LEKAVPYRDKLVSPGYFSRGRWRLPKADLQGPGIGDRAETSWLATERTVAVVREEAGISEVVVTGSSSALPVRGGSCFSRSLADYERHVDRAAVHVVAMGDPVGLSDLLGVPVLSIQDGFRAMASRVVLICDIDATEFIFPAYALRCFIAGAVEGLTLVARSGASRCLARSVVECGLVDECEQYALA